MHRRALPRESKEIMFCVLRKYYASREQFSAFITQVPTCHHVLFRESGAQTLHSAVLIPVTVSFVKKKWGKNENNGNKRQATGMDRFYVVTGMERFLGVIGKDRFSGDFLVS